MKVEVKVPKWKALTMEAMKEAVRASQEGNDEEAAYVATVLSGTWMLLHSGPRGVGALTDIWNTVRRGADEALTWREPTA